MNARGYVSGKEEIEKAICKALGLEFNRTSRIILDFDASTPLIQVYVQMVGDERLLDVDWARGLAGAEIAVLEEGGDG